MTVPAHRPQPRNVSGASAVLTSLRFLRKEMLGASTAALDLSRIDPAYHQGAANLLSYLALRRHDIRLVQAQLAELGLSSLGRCESDALGAVDQVIAVLERLVEKPSSMAADALPSLHGASSPLADHATALFGPASRERSVRIMVTMPSEAAEDPELVERLVAGGMDCQRINCAHDGPEQWLKMIEHLRAACRKLGMPCQVAMDLPGPKLRTGPVAPGTPVLKVKPTRNDVGTVREPAHLYLCRGAEGPGVGAELPERIAVGDVIRLKDARGAKRALHVLAVDALGCWVQLRKTAYLTPGLKLKVKRASGRRLGGRLLSVPAREQALTLHEGDTLVLTRNLAAGEPASTDDAGRILTPAHIGCTSPAVFEAAGPGAVICFDDGKIAGVVETATADALIVRIQHAPGGVKLKADKGINLPGTSLDLAAMGEEDIAALEFASEHADIVELSFTNQPSDARLLLQHLERLNATDLGVVFKIETRQGFTHLPKLLLEGMRNPRFGVMIARGDLAVETGFERTAELQEEMLCLCEAAHVPVIWATQVLETLAKKGVPTRAEITDAAMGIRADCVMLNKGPYILKAVATLDDLLRRMQGHHAKKRDLMRKLRVATAVPDTREVGL
ncbi:pyruvate kinase [Pseudomonas sp. Marseille-Q5115]|uniref:pyruvate kinase n=1 Tax=Pseudomonas sp. Marseille-Q5115 TaxID=2866593 RepID=UPI001CE3EF7D|nr:pyruvate kinase [Pseudomonas sp. Marseille-Q5115]